MGIAGFPGGLLRDGSALLAHRGARRRGAVSAPDRTERPDVRRDDGLRLFLPQRVVAQLHHEARRLTRPLPLAVRRAAGGRGHRELVVRLQGLALHEAHAAQIEAEREGRGRADAELHVLPVFPGRVVDDRPRLQAHLALVLELDAVARLPGGRLRHVREDHAVHRGGWQLDLHVDEASLGVRLLGGVRDGRGLPCLRVGHGERLEEVVDLVRRHAQVERLLGHGGGALEIGDPVPIDHHAAERGVRLHVARLGGAAGEEQEKGGGEERRAEERCSHGWSSRRSGPFCGPSEEGNATTRARGENLHLYEPGRAKIWSGSRNLRHGAAETRRFRARSGIPRPMGGIG